VDYAAGSGLIHRWNPVFSPAGDLGSEVARLRVHGRVQASAIHQPTPVPWLVMMGSSLASSFRLPNARLRLHDGEQFLEPFPLPESDL
jgi:hypothetical protein